MNHFKLPVSYTDREAYILNICRGHSVLHLGFADAPFTKQSISSGKWLHSKISNVAKRILGVDIDSTMIERLRQDGINNIVQHDVEELDKLQQGYFEIVLAGEIIEHLNNPGSFLDSVRHVLAPGGKLLITTINAFCLRRFIRIPFGSESVHPDHICYFSHTTLHTLAKRFGYVLEEAYSYRITSKHPFLPYIVERLSTLITPNWGEGIIHVYSC